MFSMKRVGEARSLVVAVAIVCSTPFFTGCGSEREVTDDPEAIEKARQEHMRTMQREAGEAGGGG